MGSDDDGGPAFPASEANGLNTPMWGISIRDYFAAKVVQGLLAAERGNLEHGVRAYSELVREGYAIADVMIAHRKVK